MAGGLSLVTTAALVLLGLGTLGLEIQYRLRPGNQLELTRGEWNLDLSDNRHYVLRGEMEFQNLTSNLEIMIPEVSAQLTLLSKASLDGINHTIKVIPAILMQVLGKITIGLAILLKPKKPPELKF